MSEKEYIGSQEHFEDEVNAYYDQKEMRDKYEQQQQQQQQQPQPQPTAEGAEEISKITNSPIGGVHWYRSIISKIKDIGEFLSAETPKEEYLRVWGKELFEGSLELLKIENNPTLQQQPTAEGAEEIHESVDEFLQSKDIWNHPYISDRNNLRGYEVAGLITEFATLHAQKIADKMVSERLRGELIAYEIGGSAYNRTYVEAKINRYLKSREK
jgi:hypothetical protein